MLKSAYGLKSDETAFICIVHSYAKRVKVLRAQQWSTCGVVDAKKRPK